MAQIRRIIFINTHEIYPLSLKKWLILVFWLISVIWLISEIWLIYTIFEVKIAAIGLIWFKLNWLDCQIYWGLWLLRGLSIASAKANLNCCVFFCLGLNIQSWLITMLRWCKMFWWKSRFRVFLAPAIL
jgi:hypothetical protein